MGNPKNGVALETLGCKLNQAETESLARQFAARGCQVIPPSYGASIYILNTCTVTHIADRKSRHLLRLARRRNPDSFIIAIGCYAERAAAELVETAGADMVLGNDDKTGLLDALEEQGLIGTSREPVPHMHRTRSVVKIQEGCNQSCSYCIVPLVRGKERSVPLNEAVEEVMARVKGGYQEVVLTGTQIGSYKNSLELLLQCILTETGVKRLRLSSVQPQDITTELLALWQDYPQRLCRHLHIPLQSGSEAVLQRMGRIYDTDDFKQAAAMVRQAIPDVAITTDVMIGFPGETDEEFAESYHFCQRMEFAKIHVFPYSERPGTRAALMSKKVDDQIKRERSECMLNLAKDSAHRFREQFQGHTMTVLWEQKDDEGAWVGFTDNYIRVAARSEAPLKNRLLPAILGGSHNRYAEAKLAP
jgi:threonylcarbamoyladenosine tRNA methylthiotransferase MtaB